jgi:hypothetical protein
MKKNSLSFALWTNGQTIKSSKPASSRLGFLSFGHLDLSGFSHLKLRVLSRLTVLTLSEYF